MIAERPCGWHGTVAEFLTLDQSALLDSLSARHQRVMGMGPDGLQMAAWRGEYEILGATFREIAASIPRARDWAVVFEYELPRERGRRPDVVILTGSQVIVLEFKETAALQRAHVDQVAAYARDLRHYHASHDKLVDPVLVLTRCPVAHQWPDGRHGAVGSRGTGTTAAPPYTAAAEAPGAVAPPTAAAEQDLSEVAVVNPQGLRAVIAELERRAPHEPIDAQGWLNADYSPLPSLVSAARQIFNHEPLPQIKRAQSARIPDTIATLVAAANQARENQELHLALITGVPGSGKTLVGLQFVYENHFGDTGSRRTAVFLSGNGPLVDVLQYALRSKVFVQDVHGFLKQYGGDATRTPEEHIWVYDEAQRAWDARRVLEKRGHDRSEPEDFLSIGSRKDSWALMVGLIGEGQEIYLGEEAGRLRLLKAEASASGAHWAAQYVVLGRVRSAPATPAPCVLVLRMPIAPRRRNVGVQQPLKQWNDAIEKTSDSWTVHCPRKIADIFDSADRLDTNESLDLDMSLRTHLAEDVQGWVEDLLEGRLDAAAGHAEAMERQGFRLYLTREFARATGYVRERVAA